LKSYFSTKARSASFNFLMMLGSLLVGMYSNLGSINSILHFTLLSIFTREV